jgi:outer membrane protein TolC
MPITPLLHSRPIAGSRAAKALLTALFMMGSLSAWSENLSSASASATQALTLEAALALAQERSQALIAQVAAARSAQQQTAAAEAAYRSKQGTQAAVLNAHLQQARVGDRIAAVQVRSDAARQTLQRWIGDAAPTTPGPLPEAVYRSDDLHLAAHQVDAHPELQAMQAARSLALAEVDRARADRQADPSLSVMAFLLRTPGNKSPLSRYVSTHQYQRNQVGLDRLQSVCLGQGTLLPIPYIATRPNQMIQ